MNDKKLDNWLVHVPKIELHLHLEGAIPYDVLWELVMKYGGDPSVPSLEKLQERFVFRDFAHFLATWGWKNSFIREYDDFTLIAEAVARDLAAQEIRYAEVFCTPSDHYSKNLDAQKIITAIRKGYDKVRAVKINIIVDFCRNTGPASAERDLEAVNEIKNLGILGFTIGGAEQEFPPEVYKTVYERARNLGFHLSAHAGEAAGPESIWGAIRELKVERIGHGTRIFEDPALEQYVVENKVPLEVCPISNLHTRVVQMIETHPVKHYYDRGMIVTINTDDPKMFGNSLFDEYRTLHYILGFSLPDIQNLILNGVRSSWLPLQKKRELERNFLQDPGWLIP
jgi:adenosine deaminase